MPLITAFGFCVYALIPTLFPQYAYAGLLLGTVIFSISAGLGEVLISPVVAALPSDTPDKDMSALHSLYGYGQYITDDGNIIIGKFRQGELIQGISLGKDNVIVGNKNFYCSYSLTTGKLEYIYNNGTKQISQPDDIKDYTFMSQDFANGDKFIGELYKGKRHGLGIYYYADGGLWYGCFNNDIRNGFGAWFKADNDLVIGLWDGEEERRCIFIPQK